MSDRAITQLSKSLLASPDGASTEAVRPSLEGRTARCYCGREAPSSTSLAFFEYCGSGSRSAEEHCANCRYHLRAHEHDDSRVVPTSRVERGECPSFEPLGDIGHDRFYCGHAGWD